MLHIVLCILKIIGIILAIVAGLILLVLMVPFRYKGKGSLDNEFSAKFTTGWLGFLIRFKALYEKGNIRYAFRIAGVPIKKGKINIKDFTDKSDFKDDLDEDLTEEFEKDTPEGEEFFFELVEKFEDESEKSDNNDSGKDSAINESRKDSEEENNSETGKHSGRFTVRNFIGQLKSIFTSVRDTIKNIRKEKIVITKKIKRTIKILKSKEAKEVYEFLKINIKKLINHVKPDKIKADINFGFKSPDKTGKFLAVMGMLLAALKVNTENIEIVPDFQEKKMNGSFEFSGHFVLIYVLIISIKIYFNRRVHYIIEKL